MHHITLLLLLLFASCQSNTPTTTGALPLTEEPFALLVQQNGQLIRSDYQDEKSANTLFNIQSVGKSIMALLIGIAIDEGAIESEQLSISQYFPQWVDSTKASITIYHLLHQSSG
ncbi:MAG: serine hydrolase, partial [Bacteroidota bacterium]